MIICCPLTFACSWRAPSILLLRGEEVGTRPTLPVRQLDVVDLVLRWVRLLEPHGSAPRSRDTTAVWLLSDTIDKLLMVMLSFLVTHRCVFAGSVIHFRVKLRGILGHGVLFVIHEQRALVRQLLDQLTLKK